MKAASSKKRPLTSLSHNDAWQDYAAVAHTLNLSDTIFTLATRIIRRASELQGADDQEEFSEISKLLLNMLFKSQHFSSALEVFEFNSSSREQTARFELRDWSFIISLFLLSRKMLAVCSAKELKPSFQYAYESCAVAEELAKAIPDISIGEWLIVATIRPLSLLLYAMRDTGLLVEHRRKLSTHDKSPFDIGREIELFGLPHSALCQILAQRLGLGVTTALQLRHAFDYRIPLDSLDEKATTFRAAALWLDSLMTELKPPPSEIAECFPPKTNSFKDLLSFVTLLKSEGVVGNWLDPITTANLQSPTLDDQQLFESAAQETALKQMLEVVDKEDNTQ